MRRTANLKYQTGASIVHWLVALIPLMGFGALAVDLNNVYASLGELQSSADAGALEGARVLFNPDGSINDTAVVANATAIASLNLSDGTAPELTVQHGHWRFDPSFRDGEGIEHGGTFFPLTKTDANPLTNPDGTLRAGGLSMMISSMRSMRCA